MLQHGSTKLKKQQIRKIRITRGIVAIIVWKTAVDRPYLQTQPVLSMFVKNW